MSIKSLTAKRAHSFSAIFVAIECILKLISTNLNASLISLILCARMLRTAKKHTNYRSKRAATTKKDSEVINRIINRSSSSMDLKAIFSAYKAIKLMNEWMNESTDEWMVGWIVTVSQFILMGSWVCMCVLQLLFCCCRFYSNTFSPQLKSFYTHVNEFELHLGAIDMPFCKLYVAFVRFDRWCAYARTNGGLTIKGKYCFRRRCRHRRLIFSAPRDKHVWRQYLWFDRKWSVCKWNCLKTTAMITSCELNQ